MKKFISILKQHHGLLFLLLILFGLITVFAVAFNWWGISIVGGLTIIAILHVDKERAKEELKILGKPETKEQQKEEETHIKKIIILLSLLLGSVVILGFSEMAFGLVVTVVFFALLILNADREKKRVEKQKLQAIEAKEQQRKGEVERLRKLSILANAANMEGHQFEYYCADVLRHNGFQCRVTRGSGDNGADIIAEKNGLTYAIQCKCYGGSVGNKAVQEAYSGKGYYHTDCAVVLTNSDFTSKAIDAAREMDVMLWGGSMFLELVETAIENAEYTNQATNTEKETTDE